MSLTGSQRMRDDYSRRYGCRALRIGVAREIKTDEYRVALTPAGARELVLNGHEVLVETTAGDGQLVPRRRRTSAPARHSCPSTDVWEQAEMLLKVKEPIAAEYPRLREGLVALHVSPHRRRRAAHTRSRRQRNRGRRLRDRRDGRPPAAAARADERDRRPARVAGRRVLPREAAGRPRPAPRRRSGRRARSRRRHRRRHRRLQRGDHRARSRRTGHHPRSASIDRMRHLDEILSGRVEPRDVVEPPDRGVGRGGGSRDRRGPDPGRAGSEARHARDARRDESAAR